MGTVSVRKPPRDLSLVLPIAGMPQMEQKCDHLVLLLWRQGGQLFLNFQHAHRQSLSGVDAVGKPADLADDTAGAKTILTGSALRRFP
jgi:hypothetical protein